MTRILAFAALFQAVALSGCLGSAPLGPPDPKTAAQVSSCQGTAHVHNGVVVAGIVLGGLGSTGGAVAAGLSTTNTGVKDGVMAGAAVAGATAGIMAAIAGLSAANFANSHCPSYVGELPDIAGQPVIIESSQPSEPTPEVVTLPLPGDAGIPVLVLDAGHD